MKVRLVVGCAVGAVLLAACGGSALGPAEVARAQAEALGRSVGSAPEPGPDQPGAPRASGPGEVQQDRSGPGRTAGAPDRGDRTTPTPPPDAAPPTGEGVTAGSCDGFQNGTGVTDDAIVIGTVADLSGPVPSAFAAAANATKAYAAYFNATSTICGRKLEVRTYDSQTNTSGDAVATQRTCDETFAGVGHMSAFDNGGAAVATRCRIPEIHAIITNPARAACPTCFAAEAPQGGFFPRDLADYPSRTEKAATQRAAMLYVNAAAAVEGAKTQVRSQERRGWNFVVNTGFDVAEFNYGPYVQRLKRERVGLVEMYGSVEMAVRMAKAFQSAGYRPDLFLLNATQYQPAFAGAGPAVEGAVVFIDFTPLEEIGSTPELALYDQWLQQVAPGSVPTYFGMFAWSAARLFVEQATALGGRLTRAALVDRLEKVHGWTANDLHAPQDVGGKVSTACIRFLQVRGGRWVPYGPTDYLCSGRSDGR